LRNRQAVNDRRRIDRAGAMALFDISVQLQRHLTSLHPVFIKRVN